MLKTKKFVKQFALIVLSMIMMLNFNICAIAATIDKKDDSGLQPMYTTIETNSVYISISGIKATCNATLTSQVPTSLNIKMELQKEKSNGYETIETWTKSKNGASMSFTETRNIVKFKDALGNITQYAYDANGNLTSLTNPNGGVYSYAYNKDNYQTSM